jgi:hypothetical protein
MSAFLDYQWLEGERVSIVGKVVTFVGRIGKDGLDVYVQAVNARLNACSQHVLLDNFVINTFGNANYLSQVKNRARRRLILV